MIPPRGALILAMLALAGAASDAAAQKKCDKQASLMDKCRFQVAAVVPGAGANEKFTQLMQQCIQKGGKL